jgi:hypothetical protein
VAKYADEPEPQSAPSAQASQPPQPAEQKAVTDPAPQPPQAKADGFTRPKADVPTVEAPAPSTPVAKPAPAAATKPKELDIPL